MESPVYSTSRIDGTRRAHHTIDTHKADKIDLVDGTIDKNIGKVRSELGTVNLGKGQDTKVFVSRPSDNRRNQDGSAKSG
jgi:hypothetical protein